MIFTKNRRKVSNFTIDPMAQLRFAKPFGILILVSFATINLIFWKVLNVRVAAEAAASTDAIVILNNMMSQLVLWASAGMAVIGLLTLILWIIYSHRIFGPLVPIRRQVQNLIKGDYDFQIKLRKNDELKELAEELNALAVSLKAKHGR